jgi:hypothetical protein
MRKVVHELPGQRLKVTQTTIDHNAALPVKG